MSQNFESINQWFYNMQTNAWMKLNRKIITEKSITLKINGEQWLSFICSPTDLEALAVGFLYNEGVITDMEQVKHIQICADTNNIEVDLYNQADRPNRWQRTTTGITFDNPFNPVKPQKDYRITAKELVRLYEKFTSKQVLHQAMGGFHSAALSDGKDVNISVEDVGRHNALDKIAGQFLLQGKSFTPHLVFLSGRVSSEMIRKSLSAGISIIVSRTTPTFNAVQTAHNYNITLVGYMRNDRFTAYTHPERIALE